MSKIEFAEGVAVMNEGKLCTIVHVLDLETLLVRDEESGKKKQVYIKDLKPVGHEQARENPKVKELSLIKTKDWKEAERWLELLKPLLSASRRTRKMAKEVARKAGVGVATVYRKLQRYERLGRTSDLTPYRPNGGRGGSRLSKDVETIIQEVIGELYKNMQRHKARKIFQEVESKLINAGLPVPHPNTIRNRIKAIPPREADESRLGSKAANKKYSPFPGHFPGGDWPLAVVQIDHTKLDIMIVDDIARENIGRPYITVAIDVFSRMVVGFYVSLDPPGNMSAGLCLSHAILPKDIWLADRGITTSWPCWGFMKQIHADNAGEFRGEMLKMACKEYNMDLEWRPVGKPEYGAHIERLIGTLKEEIHSLPGTTFSNPQEKGEYDSEKNAAFTLSELETRIANFIVGVYHQRIHSALGTSPLKQYERGIFGDKDAPGTGLPPREFDEDRLRLDLMPYEMRTIQQYGVMIEKVGYYSGVLRNYINEMDPDHPTLKRKFVFRQDPRRISPLYFYDPVIGQHLEVPYSDTSRPVVSKWELKRARNRLEAQGVKNPDVNEDVIFRTIEQMRVQEDEVVRETKSVRRNKQRRAIHSKVEKIKTADKQESTNTDDEDLDKLRASIVPFDDREDLI